MVFGTQACCWNPTGRKAEHQTTHPEPPSYSGQPSTILGLHLQRFPRADFTQLSTGSKVDAWFLQVSRYWGIQSCSPQGEQCKKEASYL